MATPAFYLALLPAPAAAAAGSAVVAAVAAPALPPSIWLLGIMVGTTTSIILFCSHFHQIDGDTAAGKRSPLVRLGLGRAVRLLSWVGVLPYAVCVASAVARALPLPPLLLSLLTLPLLRDMLAFAEANEHAPALLAPLKRYAVKWHVGFGLSLVAGLVLSGRMGTQAGLRLVGG